MAFFEKQVRQNLGKTENVRGGIPLQKMPRLNTVYDVTVCTQLTKIQQIIVVVHVVCISAVSRLTPVF